MSWFVTMKIYVINCFILIRDEVTKYDATLQQNIYLLPVYKENIVMVCHYDVTYYYITIKM